MLLRSRGEKSARCDAILSIIIRLSCINRDFNVRASVQSNNCQLPQSLPSSQIQPHVDLESVCLCERLCKVHIMDRRTSAPHLTAPDGFGRVELSQENLREAIGLVVLQVTDHRLGEQRPQDRPLHDVRTLHLECAEGFIQDCESNAVAQFCVDD